MRKQQYLAVINNLAKAAGRIDREVESGVVVAHCGVRVASAALDSDDGGIRNLDAACIVALATHGGIGVKLKHIVRIELIVLVAETPSLRKTHHTALALCHNGILGLHTVVHGGHAKRSVGRHIVVHNFVGAHVSIVGPGDWLRSLGGTGELLSNHTRESGGHDGNQVGLLLKQAEPKVNSQKNLHHNSYFM